MPRILADASSLIALGKVGELDVIRDTLGEVLVTETVRDEVLSGDAPGVGAVRKAIEAGWIEVLDDPGDRGDPAGSSGLDAGEVSLFMAAEPGDVLLLDEREARRFADASGFPYTGVLGLVVQSVREEQIEGERGRAIVRKLARSDFRMTTTLYDWALEEIEQVRS